MRKFIIMVFLIINLMQVPISKDSGSTCIAKPKQSNQYTEKNQSKEELYQDIFVTLLDSYIQKGITDYYGEPYSFDLFNIKVLNIDRPLGYRSFEFIIKLQVKPFIGAHNVVGIDNITLRIQPGKVNIEKFEHIKSFEIPQYLQ